MGIFTFTRSVGPAVLAARTIGAGMVWAAISSIDWDGDHERIRRWIETVFARSPPDAAMTGLYFGRFNPTRLFRASADL